MAREMIKFKDLRQYYGCYLANPYNMINQSITLY